MSVFEYSKCGDGDALRAGEACAYCGVELLGSDELDPVAVRFSQRSCVLRGSSDVDLGAGRVEVLDEDLVFPHDNIISNVSSRPSGGTT